MEEWLDKLVIVQIYPYKDDPVTETYFGVLKRYDKGANYITLSDCVRVLNLNTNDIITLNKFGIERQHSEDFIKDNMSEEIKFLQLFNISKIFALSDIFLKDLGRLLNPE